MDQTPVNDREALWARRIVLWVPVLVLVLVGGVRLIIHSRPVKEAVAIRLAERAAATSRAAVRIEDLSFGWLFQPCLHRASLKQQVGEFRLSATAESACARQWPTAVGSGFRAVNLFLDAPRIRLEGMRTDLLRPVAKRPRAVNKDAPLREFVVRFDALEIDWKKIPVLPALSTGRFGPVDGVVSIKRRAGRTAADLKLHEKVTGFVFDGRALPINNGFNLEASLVGDVAPLLRDSLERLKIDLRALPIDAKIGVTYNSPKLTLEVQASLKDVDLSADVVSARRVHGVRGHLGLRLEAHLEKNEFVVKDANLELDGVPILLSLLSTPTPAGPHFRLAGELRTVPMTRVLRAIPGRMPLPIGELSADTLFSALFTLSGVVDDPATWQPKLEHRLTAASGGLNKSGLAYLVQPFEYYPLTAQGRRSEARRTGPTTRGWLRFRDIPYITRRAVQVAEDANFWLHPGIDLEAVKEALVEGQRRQKRTRGASTISQQLVKNLLLSPERTAARKLQELVLTLLVESALSKEQIFELYINLIEWGPNIYGLPEAAQYYFGKRVQDLTPKESVYLATIIPAPVRYHQHFKDRFVARAHVPKMNRLLERLRRLGTITSRQYDQATDTDIRFRSLAR